jgi:hypothetical protein
MRWHRWCGAALGCALPGILSAAVGVAVYESKGLDARRTQTGHSGLVATQVCAEGIQSVRRCRPGETPGVVISRYTQLAWGQPLEVIVVPMRPHFLGVDDPADLPLLSTGAVLKQVQIAYWRDHLRSLIPPLTQEQYEKLHREHRRMTPGKLVKNVAQFEFLIKALAPANNAEPTEPVALRDTVTGLLVPNGRWRGVVGVRHERDSVLFLTETTVDQELRLAAFLTEEADQKFNALKSNCSDFVNRGLAVALREMEYERGTRPVAVADAFVTSPLTVANDFVRFLKKRDIPYQVVFLPMLPGSRQPSAAVRRISSGVLLPTPEQGLLAFGIKVGLFQMNPLIPLIGGVVNGFSPAINPDREVTRNPRTLSQFASWDTSGSTSAAHAFGTRACWEEKRGSFRQMVDWLQEQAVLPPGTTEHILRNARPFAYARLLEREGRVSAGMTRASVASIIESEPVFSDQIRTDAVQALVAAVNFDLTSFPLDRRAAGEFDADWDLLVRAMRRFEYPAAGQMEQGVSACSATEADAALREGRKIRDERSRGHGPWRWMKKQGWLLVRGPLR